MPQMMQTRTQPTIGPVVYEDVRGDLIPAIREAILARWQSGAAGTASLNHGGWKSTDDLPWWPDPAIREWAAVLQRDFLQGRPIASAWAMVNRLGSSHPRHIHRTATRSGVYFVDAGEAPTAPLIVEAGPGNVLTIDPNPARLVIFSGRTYHRVPRYDGDAPRISIAFDVR